jgi:hypothetical protein
MSAETGDVYSGGTSPEDFLEPDDPDEHDDVAGQGTEPEAPHGWTTDPKTGERRPKIRPGRPRKPPSADELAAAPPVDRQPDAPPAQPQGRRGKVKPQPDGEVPMPRGGVIADGVNRLYRRAGKVIRAMDADIGQAVIACTRAEDDDDITVGEAWERLCKANPRIRRFVLQAIAGGAWGDLILAHAPIGMAIVMKPWIQRNFLGRLVESVAEPDEDSPEGGGGLPGGMTAADAGEMQAMAEQQMRRMASKMGVRVTEADLAKARAAADQLGAGNGRRVQPKRTTRAQRAGGKAT